MATSKETKKTAAVTESTSNIDEYNAMINIISEVPLDNAPVRKLTPSKLISEAERLYHWARIDEEILVKSGLAADAIGRLQLASGALRTSVGTLSAIRSGKNPWLMESPEAFAFLDRLAHDFRFAYRDNPAVLELVRLAVQGDANDDKVQQLMNLAAIGRNYQRELELIGFDLTQLDKAAALSARMGDLLGAAKTGTSNENAARKIRDQAYTYLQGLMSEIREYGRYVFYRNPDRLGGYLATRIRKHKTITPTAEAAAVPQAPLAAELREAA